MEQIGRYKVLGELGRGAMGVVYRALDPSIGRTVAIKTIRLTEFADPDERARLQDRLLREARSAGLVNHPNIVTIYDVAEEGDTAYIAMEFVDGPTLAHMMAEGQAIDNALILTILHQTATALDFAHKRGVVHRDVKPANIMLHEGSVVKVTDFGVAKIESQQMTQGGALLGTPNYMSPEQIQGLPVDGRSDQFSLAVIAYELLTGDKPFNADNMPGLVYKIVHDAPTAPQRINPTLGWTVDTVLLRALSKKPDERFETCTAFIRALENATKASKNWKPLPPGRSQDMPTIVGGPEPLLVATPESARPPLIVPPGGDEQERPSTLLRLARFLAAVIVGAAIVSAVMVTIFDYLGRETPPPPEVQDLTKGKEPAASPQSPTLPGESPSGPVAEGAKPEPVQPEPAPAEAPKEETAKVEAPVPATPERVTDPLTGQRKTVKSADAEVRIITSPPGASVTIDNAPSIRCKTPCTLTLPAGRHTLDATLAGFRRSLKIFEIPRDSEVFTALERATGTLSIRSDPPGATIMVDGQTRPEKTPASITLTVGKHKLEVSKEGFEKHVEEVETREAVMSIISVDWSGKGTNQ